jgi:hypothetical protein
MIKKQLFIIFILILVYGGCANKIDSTDNNIKINRSEIVIQKNKCIEEFQDNIIKYIQIKKPTSHSKLLKMEINESCIAYENIDCKQLMNDIDDMTLLEAKQFIKEIDAYITLKRDK